MTHTFVFDDIQSLRNAVNQLPRAERPHPMVLLRYQAAEKTLRDIPKTLENLEALVLATREAITSYENAIKKLPKLQGNLVFMRMQLKVWETLRQYRTDEGKRKLYHALKFRFENRNGVELTYLTNPHKMETLDPLNRCRAKVEQLLLDWLDGLNGADPVENVVQFLFDFDRTDNDISDPSGYDNARRSAFRIFSSHSKLTGYYVEPPEKQCTRYNPLEHSAIETITAIQRKPLNTTGGGASRGGGDFVEGDPYVLSPDDKMYSSNFNSVFHSFFLAGEAVKGAGLWVVKDGKVLMVDNRSGHYMPGWRGLLQSVEYIAAQGAFSAEAAVGLVISGEDVMYFRVQDFIRLGKAQFPYEATRQVIQGYYKAFKGFLPVAKPYLKYVGTDHITGWECYANNRWDRWLSVQFPAWHREPIVAEPKFKSPDAVLPQRERRFGGMA